MKSTLHLKIIQQFVEDVLKLFQIVRCAKTILNVQNVRIIVLCKVISNHALPMILVLVSNILKKIYYNIDKIIFNK